jgi:hypothetical protein
MNDLNTTAESEFLFRDRDRPVTIPSLGVLNLPTSLSVLNRPLALFILRTAKDALRRLKTLKDVGRFRTPRDGIVTGRRRNGDGHGTKTLTPL